MDGALTVRQRKFWKHYSEHNNLAAAAEYAGCKCNSLAHYSYTGRQLLNSLKLSMPELLNAMGLDDKFMAEKILDGCYATRTPLASFEGKFKDERVLDDYPTRAKDVEL